VNKRLESLLAMLSGMYMGRVPHDPVYNPWHPIWVGRQRRALKHAMKSGTKKRFKR
jgi:hypothetical protein